MVLHFCFIPFLPPAFFNTEPLFLELPCAGWTSAGVRQSSFGRGLRSSFIAFHWKGFSKVRAHSAEQVLGDSLRNNNRISSEVTRV